MLCVVDTNLGARIRSAREARGLSRTQLAELVDVFPGTVKNWEAGRVPQASIGKLEAVLGITLRDTGGHEPRLSDASHAQILAELGRRDADKDARIAAILNQPPYPPDLADIRRTTSGRVLRAARTRQPADPPPADAKPDGPDGTAR